MGADFPVELEHKLHRGDGYRSKPMWSQEDNNKLEFVEPGLQGWAVRWSGR